MNSEKINGLVEAAEGIKDILLANLVMIGEVPARTFKEDARVAVLLERFSECGMSSCSSDESCNAFGIIHGSGGKKPVLIVSNVDALVDEDYVPVISIGRDIVTGPFVGDNSIALAAMATLPVLFEKAGWRPKNDIVFMGASRMLGRGNLSGLSAHLNSPSKVPAYGICLDSVSLGRLNYACLGILVGDIVTRLSESYNWVQFGATGSIIPMSEIISRLNSIPLPRRPLTSIVLGSIHGGVSHGNIATKTRLSFQVRSESKELLSMIDGQIKDICEEVSANSGVKVEVDLFARSEPGALEISHPLVRCARDVHGLLGIESRFYQTTFALSAFLSRKIPAICLGITSATRTGNRFETEEAADIEPMTRGLAQLAAVIMEIDSGRCKA